jgi:hypothetical protein
MRSWLTIEAVANAHETADELDESEIDEIIGPTIR